MGDEKSALNKSSNPKHISEEKSNLKLKKSGKGLDFKSKSAVKGAHFKKAEDEREHFASFPRLNPNPVLEVDSSGRITFHNDATVKVLKKLNLKKDVNVFLPEDITKILEALKRKKEGQFYREVQLKDKTFSEVLYLDPQFNTVRIYANDISEHKKAVAAKEELLKYRHHLEEIVEERTAEMKKEITQRMQAEEELKRFASFPRLNPNPVLEVDSSGKIIFRNNATIETLKKINLNDANIFLPDDISDILKALNQKSERQFYREVIIKGKIFGEVLHFAPQFNAIRIYATDITELKKAEMSLKRERDFFTAVLSTAGALVVILDLHGRIVSFNKTCELITGYTFDEVKGKPFWNILLIPEEVEPVKSIFKELKTGQFPNKHENYWVTKDGSLRLIAWSNTALLDSIGNVEYVIGTGIDITERKQAEEALQKALDESRQRHLEILALLEGSQAVLKYQDFKSAAQSIFNSCKNLIGATAGYVALLSKDGKENEVVFLDSGGLDCTVDRNLPMPIRGLRAEVYHNNKAAYHNNFSNSEWMKFMPKGHVRLDNVLFAPMIIEGKVIGLLGIANKLGGFNENDARMATAFAELASIALVRKRAEEALRLSEEYFRLLIENALDVITILEADGTIRYESPSIERVLGYKREDLIGRNAFEIVHPDDLQDVMKIFAHLAKNPGSTVFMQLRCQHKDGSWPILEVTGNNLLNNLTVAGIVLNSRDITERKKMEDEVRKSRDELEIRVQERTKELAKANEELQNKITELKLAKDTLIEQSSLLEAFFKHTINPLVFFDRDFNFIRVNEAYAKACQRDISEFYGHNHFEFYPHEENEAIFRQVVKTKIPYQAIAKPFVFPDHPEWGITYWDWTLTPLFDADGEVKFLVFALNDVTERKKVESRDHLVTQLLELFAKKTSRKEYLDSVVQLIHNWTGCRHAGIRIVNEERYIPYNSYVGFSEEFMGLENMISLDSDSCACIRVIAGKFELQDASAITLNGSFRLDNSIKFADQLTKNELARFRGNCIRSGYASIAVIPIRYLTQPLGAIHLADEREGMVPLNTIQFLESLAAPIIGEAIYRFFAEEALLKSEVRLSEAQRIAHLGNWEWDIRKNELYWSDEIYRIFGLIPQQFGATYDAFLDFVHPDDRESVKAAVNKALYEKEPYSIDHSIILPDGKSRVVHEYGEVVFDESGKPIKMIGTVQDITESKIAEEELKKSSEQLHNLYAYLQSAREEERTRIAREIHDEFGTILTALKIDLSWLEKKLPQDQSIIERTKKDIDLINSAIKTVQRISSELRPGILDHLGLSAAVEWQVKEFGNRTGVKWDIAIDIEKVTHDRDLSTAIFRILQESLTNIARHAEATKVSVSLNERGSLLVLEVKDNGKGINEDQISDPHSFGVMGIRERVKYWSGDVEIQGIPNKGTVVTVRIPLENKEISNDKDTHR